MSRAAAPAIKGNQIKLSVGTGPCKGQVALLTGNLITIGRGPENNFVLPLDGKISRNHVEMHLSITGTLVKSLSQKNQVIINGEQIIEKLVKGDFTIQMGDSEIKIERPDLVKEANAPNLRVIEDSKSVSQTQGAVSVRKSDVAKTQTGAMTRPIGDGALTHPQMGGPPAGPPGFDPTANGGFQGIGQGPAMPPPSTVQNLLGNPRVRFYLIIAVVGLAVVWLMSGQVKKNKAALQLRDSVQSNDEFLKSEAEIKKITDDPKFKARESVQYQMAEQHFTRGFRDYNQGQWTRSIEAFQAALSFYPSHELARKYYQMAQTKFDKQLRMHMVQGKQYFGMGNFRRCMDEFKKVMIMKKDQRDVAYKEARQFYSECDLKLKEGK